MFIICFSVLLAIPYEEGKDEWIVSGAVEAAHSLMAGEHSVLDVSQRVSVYRWVVLVGASEEKNIRVHIRRKVFHIRLPGLVPVRVRTARKLHVQEHPVLKYDAEGIRTPIEVASLLGHIDSCTGALDGIPRLIECRIERLDEDGDFSLVIEVRELLETDRILVLDPGLDGGTTVVIPRIGGVDVAVLERQNDASNGASVDAEVGDINLQHIHTLICRIRGVV